MAVITVTTLSPGLVGVHPKLIYILTNDTLATVGTTGYLNHWNSMNPGQLQDGDMALVITSVTPSSTNVDSGFLQVNFASGNWSLTPTNTPGDVTLPTIANHIATYTNTTGGLSEDPTTAISGGNIQAGLSGAAGQFISFPATAANGTLIFSAVNAGGAFNTTLSNGTMAQSTVFTLPDPSNAVARVLVGATATPFTTGHLLASSGTGGLVADSGVATSAIQLKANIKAATTSNIGGSGAGPVSVVVAGLTTASVVVATIASSSAAVAVASCIATNTGFNITFDADPGASCIVNYVAFVVAQ